MSKSIITAAILNDIPEVQRLISAGVNVNLQDDNGNTALMSAARRGQLAVVRVLLAAKNIDVNICNYSADDGFEDQRSSKSGQTALMYATEEGHIEIVRTLLAVENIDVNLKNNAGDSALMKAVSNGNAKIVRALLAVENIDVNIRKRFGRTALMLAAEEGHTEVIPALLSVKDIDVNLQDYRGDTALAFSVIQGHVEVVRLLLSTNRINFKLHNYDNITPLKHATSLCRVEIVSLIEHFQERGGKERERSCRKRNESERKESGRQKTERQEHANPRSEPAHHNDNVYQEERAPSEQLRKQVADMVANAARMRSVGDVATAEVFEKLVADMKAALPKVQKSATRMSYARVNTPLDFKIDLHTLHRSEIAELLDRKLKLARALAEDQVVLVCIISGRGSHSDSGEAKLKPVVRAYLDEHHLKYTEEVGCFRLKFQPFHVPS